MGTVGSWEGPRFRGEGYKEFPEISTSITGPWVQKRRKLEREGGPWQKASSNCCSELDLPNESSLLRCGFK